MKFECIGEIEGKLRQVVFEGTIPPGKTFDIIPAKKGYSILIHSCVGNTINYEYVKERTIDE